MAEKHERADGYRCRGCGLIGQPEEFEYFGKYEMSYSSDMMDYSMEPNKDCAANECSCGHIGPVDYIHIASGEDWWGRKIRLEDEYKKRRNAAIFNMFALPFKCVFWFAKWCVTPKKMI